MSLIKSILQQLGLSTTPANNFTLDASANNGTMKLARGNAGATTQDIMTVDAAGYVAFPQMPESVALPNGFFTLPNGWIVQYGTTNVPSGGAAIGFPKVFPNFVMVLVASCRGGAAAYATHQSLTTAGAYLQAWNNYGATTNDVDWIAIGI